MGSVGIVGGGITGGVVVVVGGIVVGGLVEGGLVVGGIVVGGIVEGGFVAGGFVVTVVAGGLVAGGEALVGPVVATTGVGVDGTSVIDATCGSSNESGNAVVRLGSVFSVFVVFGSEVAVVLDGGAGAGDVAPAGAITVVTGRVVVVDEPPGTGASAGTVSCANAT